MVLGSQVSEDPFSDGELVPEKTLMIVSTGNDAHPLEDF
jgi:hypothetical protein